ncbi:MAG TPA: nicotinate-nucleotide--dimethylbenzimidazole phosphoribosyltransferase, partial [Planctomycetaceae bacterium]|nr:nicotinate-nucleotide--dimethylbenzimidazole phosphoribosyltransferase [Planctomycetaceae bacterium]
MATLERTIERIGLPDQTARAKARARLDRLIMPHWALGRLMDLAVDLAGITGQVPPRVDRKVIVTMAGDHGVVAEGVSLYPQAVTAQMVKGFVSGRAAVNALARLNRASVVVVDMGVAADLGRLAAQGRIITGRVAAGTQSIARGPAMTLQQARRAVEAGIEVAEELGPQTDVFGTGDMGIGNTTPSAAIAAVVTGAAVEEVTGRGTGIDDRRLAHKMAVVRRAIERNRPNPADGLDVLAKVGGFEIGGIAGLILGAAAQRKPVLVDG